uniref:Protein kinase domain-containing protein n=1 Tax=Mycena chlorophos TaxID=658473 RepID=A0ABQ0LTI7_MYCCL|nr:predicted protein [Mycena chlorophos]
MSMDPWIIPRDEIVLEDDTNNAPRLSQATWKNAPVVVKILSEQAEATILAEKGELWTSLRHENVLQTFGISPVDAEPLYFVMPHLPNSNVMAFLKQNPSVDRAKIVYDVVLGCQYLHSRGVVHGGLRPSNILIGADGSACVSDYGLVEVQPPTSSGHRYLSPEGWKGTVSRASDVYAWAMCAFEIFSSTKPWGVLSEKNIYRLVVQEDTRPDRPDEDYGLTDHTWGVMEECWHKVSRLRPTFEILTQLLRSNARIAPLSVHDRGPRTEVVQDTAAASNADALASLHDRRTSYAASIVSVGPPSYEAAASAIHPTFAPEPAAPVPAAPPDSPGARKRAMMNAPYHPQNVTTPLPSPTPALPQLPPRPPEILRYTEEDVDRMGMMLGSSSMTPPDTPNSPWTAERRLTPSSSVRTTSSGTSSRSHRSTGSGAGSSRPLPERLQTIGSIGEELPPDPYPPRVDSSAGNRKHQSGFMSEYSPPPSSTVDRAFHHAYAESVRSQGASTIGGTSLNAGLLAGALLTEAKEGRKPEVIDEYLAKVHTIAMRSPKDVQKLVTAGLIPTLITLLKTRAADGIGLEPVLIALGLLVHDPITANTIFRTNSTATFIQILEAAQSDEIASLSVWCVTRMARSPEIANGLLKQGIAKVLVSKGLKGGPLTSRISAWCIGALVRSDAIADAMADSGMTNALSEHLRRVQASNVTGAEDRSATLYAVGRLSRSIKIAKALARGGTTEILAQILSTETEPRVLQFAARAVGCLMRPNSGDMAKTLLDAGIAKGLARLPSVLPHDELLPLGALAFAVQRFSCAEWGGGTRKALVDAGVVDSLLASLRTAADEAVPDVHIELAYAIALLSDVGGGAIRKEIVSAGGIDILKQIAASPTVKPEVSKACNLAVTSITGNLWTRNAASAKAAMYHDWSSGMPDYVPECPLPLEEIVMPE